MKKRIRLTENDLHKIIKQSTINIINEISLAPLKKKYTNKIYKHINKLTSSIYHDDDWRMVSVIFDKIEDIIKDDNGELNIWVENGGYWKPIFEFPNYKEYRFSVEYSNGVKINGSLKCHSAGTLDNPFLKYDITVTMW